MQFVMHVFLSRISFLPSHHHLQDANLNSKISETVGLRPVGYKNAVELSGTG